MDRRRFLGVAAFAAGSVALDLRLPRKPTTGLTVDGVWYPSGDAAMQAHGGWMDGKTLVLYEPMTLSKPFLRLSNCNITAAWLPPPPLGLINVSQAA